MFNSCGFVGYGGRRNITKIVLMKIQLKQFRKSMWRLVIIVIGMQSHPLTHALVQQALYSHGWLGVCGWLDKAAVEYRIRFPKRIQFA